MECKLFFFHINVFIYATNSLLANLQKAHTRFFFHAHVGHQELLRLLRSELLEKEKEHGSQRGVIMQIRYKNPAV